MFDRDELLDGIALIFVEAARHRNQNIMSTAAWLVASEERRNRREAERMLWNYHHRVKKSPKKYARKLEVSREAVRRYRAKKRLENPPTKVRRVSEESKARIKELRAQGLTHRQISMLVGLSNCCVCKVLQREKAK